MTRRPVPSWLGRGAWLLLAVLAAELVAVPRLAGAAEGAAALSRIRPVYLVTGVLLEAAAVVAYAALTRAVLPRTGRRSLWTLLRVDVTCLGVSHVVPGGDATASALRYWLLVECGTRPRDAGLAVTVQPVGSAVVLNVILWLALVVSIPTHGANPLYGAAAAVGAILLILAGVVVVALTRGQQRAVRVVRAVAARIPHVDPDAAERGLRNVGVRLVQMGSDRRLLLSATGWAAANWLLDAASLWVFVAAFGYYVSPDGLLVAFGLANVLAVLPVTPGGLGIVEGVLVPTLVAFGAPAGVALLGVLAYRLVNFWLPIPVAGAAYLSLRRTTLPKHRIEDGDTRRRRG